MFALGKVLDSFLYVVADAADGDLAVFIGSRFAIEGFHEGVGEEAVGLLTALKGVLSHSLPLASPSGLCHAKATPLFPQLGVRRSQIRNGYEGLCAILSGTGLPPHYNETTLYIHAFQCKVHLLMIDRPFWKSRLDRAWSQVPLVWLAGVRRAGKTVLSRELGDAEFLNCDLPHDVARLADPEAFFRSLKKPLVILDEVHQLSDPSRVLKIATDVFPHLRVLATGSSTLAATRKFRDTLTGRKRSVVLAPVLAEELPAFGVTDLNDRLLRGGLPPALLAKEPNWEFYAEWLDSYFARDVQEMFRVEKRSAFLLLVELVLRQSGGLLEVTSLAKHAGVSRPTVMNWMEVLQATHVAHLLRPFSGGGRRELISRPKLYGFDTGFVCHARGWDKLRPEDCGLLWEHLVLDTLMATPVQKVHFWRDASGREVDFVVPRAGGRVDAIECKWNAEAFDTNALRTFREAYPDGRNLVLCPHVMTAYERLMGGLKIEFLPISELRQAVS